MPGSRALQKEKTRHAIIEAALSQLSANQSFSNLSLREVAREANIAPTSFYRHFTDMNELGLTLVDECGVTLRQLMRQARRRIEKKGSVLSTSVETFMEFIQQNPNIFRLLLRERSGTSAEFRDAVAREIRHFQEELTDYLKQGTPYSNKQAFTLAEALVTLVFNAGAEALDIAPAKVNQLTQRTILQLRLLNVGAMNIFASKQLDLES